MRKLLACLVLLIFTAPAASACDGFGCGGGCGYGFGLGVLYNSLDSRVPHFAAYPPVYYSHPVPRTYGYSPFAYLPHVRTPEIALPVGEILSNPHVPSPSDSTPASETSEREVSYSQERSQPVQPLIIENPFVVNDSVAVNR